MRGRKLLTKAGRYGTLYRYEVPYTDPWDPGFPPYFTWRCWAYSREHALLKFEDGHEDLGFKPSGPPRTVHSLDG